MENAIIYEVHWWKCYLIARKLFVFIILRSHGSELPSRIQSWIANNKIARNDMRDFFSTPLFYPKRLQDVTEISLPRVATLEAENKRVGQSNCLSYFCYSYVISVLSWSVLLVIILFIGNFELVSFISATSSLFDIQKEGNWVTERSSFTCTSKAFPLASLVIFRLRL